MPGNEFGGQRWKPIIVAIGIAVFDDDVLSLDEPRFSHAPAKRVINVGAIIPADAAHISDHWHCRLLCARGERPRSRRAAEKRDELAPHHSITSSAIASNVGGT